MIRRKVTIALALAGVLVLVVALPARGQAPCPCQPAADKGPPPWEGKISLGYAATGGNSSTSTLTTGFDVAYRPLPWTQDDIAARIVATVRPRVHLAAPRLLGIPATMRTTEV